VRVELNDGVSQLVVIPAMGAAIGRFDLLREGSSVPLMRPMPAEDVDDPFSLACNLLLPWGNRISGGGFHHDGRFIALQPNVAGEPFPIHGNGFLSAWQVTARDDDAVTLTLESDGPGPFAYTAQVGYRLERGTLTVRLAVEHLADLPLPYGFGFHPWFPRTPGVLVTMPSDGVWLEDERYLPTVHKATPEVAEWDFRTPRTLPGGWINNDFTGWNGTARIEWPERAVALELSASANLSTALLYSPGATASFFCLEPMSHTVDAHNMPDPLGGSGLRVLRRGERAVSACIFRPVDLREPG
jgi:aldose 1-epimerase